MKGTKITVSLDFKREIEETARITGASQRHLANLVRDATLALANAKIRGQLLPLYRKALDEKLQQMNLLEEKA